MDKDGERTIEREGDEESVTKECARKKERDEYESAIEGH